MTSTGNEKNGSEAKKLHFISQNNFVRICETKSVCHGEMRKQKELRPRASGKVEGSVQQGKGSKMM
jgi:hypothetical protein